MSKRETGRGRFIEIRIIDQFNSHDIIFKGKANLDDREKVIALLRAGELDWYTKPEPQNRDYLFGKKQ